MYVDVGHSFFTQNTQDYFFVICLESELHQPVIYKGDWFRPFIVKGLDRRRDKEEEMQNGITVWSIICNYDNSFD